MQGGQNVSIYFKNSFKINNGTVCNKTLLGHRIVLKYKTAVLLKVIDRVF